MNSTYKNAPPRTCNKLHAVTTYTVLEGVVKAYFAKSCLLSVVKQLQHRNGWLEDKALSSNLTILNATSNRLPMKEIGIVG